MDIPTPQTSFVDLWINDTHLGLYTQVEQVDQIFINQHFADTTGNLYKPEPPAGYLKWTEADLEVQQATLGTTVQDDLDRSLDINIGGGRLSEILRAFQQGEAGDETTTTQPPDLSPGILPPPPPAMHLPGEQPPPPPPGAPPGQPRDYLELMALKTNENYPDHSALFHLLDILNNEPDETFPTEIEKVLDVDEVLRYLAVSTLIVHLDNYLGMGHNYYLYEVNGKFTMIPWDLNEAFGTFNRGLDREGTINFFIDEPTVGTVAERPLVNRLLSHQPYLDTYHGYLETLLDGPFSVDVMESRINELADRIRPYVEADELKFFSTEGFERALTMDVGAKIGLKTFVVERSESVKQQLDGNWPSGSGDGSGNEVRKMRNIAPSGQKPNTR